MFDLHVTMLIRFLVNRLSFWKNSRLSKIFERIIEKCHENVCIFYNIDIDINECRLINLQITIFL